MSVSDRLANPGADPGPRSIVSGKAYFVPLTSLRGVAALLVVLFHAAILGLAPHFVRLSMLPEKSYLWVDFFFMLSGFVIAHTYGERFVGGISRLDFADYLIARFARIYPLHLTVLLVLLAVILARPFVVGDIYPDANNPGGLGPQDFTAGSFFGHLLLVQAWPFDAQPTWNTPAWSISCEAAAYVAFPLLSVALARRGGWALWPALLVAAATLICLFVIAVPHSLDAGYGIIRCGAEFTIGVCLYRFYSAELLPAFLARDAVGWLVVSLVAVSLHLGLGDVVIVAEMALLLLVAVVNRGWLRVALEMRFAVFLGRISYSIYMVHFPLFFVVALAARALGGPEALLHQSPAVRGAIFLLLLPLVIALATLTYETIEAPCRRAIAPRRRRRATKEAGPSLVPASGAD